MTTDNELLELAAEAARIKFYISPVTGLCYLEGSITHWNPLTDDGDALRLAVKLKLQIQINEASAIVESWQSDIGETKEFVEYFDLPEESYAATRRAIVRAAAEIERSMKDE